MHGAQEVVLYLELSEECGADWVGEDQSGKSVDVCITFMLDASQAAECGGSVSTSHE
jgi:hypothetical protein